MTRLDALLNELCPDGVPFKRLEECCILEKGNTPIQKAIPGEYPLVVTTNERKSSNTFQFDQPSVCVPLVSSRGHGVACLNQVYYQEGRFALGNILCAVTPLKESELSAKFLYYYLNLKKDTLIVPLMKGGANVSLTVNSLKKVKVAIPPLLVQDEIVERLQTFEELLDTLSSELSARRNQYKYYSQQLLEEYKKESRKVPISALGKWQGGKTPSMQEKRFWENGSIPWISSKDMKSPVLTDTEDHITEAALSEASMNLLPEESVAIVTRSGILKHTFPVAFVPFRTTVNQDIKALSVADGVSARYVSFALQAYGEDIRTKTKK